MQFEILLDVYVKGNHGARMREDIIDSSLSGRDDAKGAYSIGELAEEFGITARALRFYEDKGLLRPARLGQARVYSAADRARLRLILRGKRVGFTLDEIHEMMDLRTLGVAGPVRLAPALARFRDRIEALKQQQSDIEDSIADLKAGCAWLEARLDAREPSEEIKKNASAFEALAKATMGA